jgi:hypothetical protein
MYLHINQFTTQISDEIKYCFTKKRVLAAGPLESCIIHRHIYKEELGEMKNSESSGIFSFF